jgi:hypothetical protein
VLSIALLVGGACAYAVLTAAPSLTSLVPADTVGIATADAPWWWKAAEPVRGQAKVAEAITKFESDYSVDIEKDVLPWAGHVSVALTGDAAAPKPDILIYVEVRDWDKFLAMFGKVRDRFQATQKGGKWTDTIYSGAHIQGFLDEKGKPIFETTIIGSWLVLGTPNAPRKAVDVWQNRKPSILKSAAWSSVINHLPEDSVLWCGLNVATASSAGSKVASVKKPGSALVDSIMGMSFTDMGNGIRWDSVNVPVTPHARNLWASLAHGSVKVSPDALKMAPNDATMTVAMNNPNRWWQRMKIMSTDGMSPKELHAYQKSIKGAKPVEDMLADFTGDTTLSVSLPDIMNVSFAIASKAATDVAAQNRVTRLAKSLRALGAPLYKSGNTWFIKTPPSKGPGPVIAPAFKAAGSVVRLASTNKALNAPTGAPALVLPAEATGSDVIVVGNFKFLPMLADQASAMAGAESKRATSARDAVKAMDLDKAQWCVYGRGAIDGSLQQQAFIIQDWDWRTAFAKTLQIIVTEADNAAEGKPDAK